MKTEAKNVSDDELISQYLCVSLIKILDEIIQMEIKSKQFDGSLCDRLAGNSFLENNCQDSFKLKFPGIPTKFW